jgi:aquaporin Z
MSENTIDNGFHWGEYGCELVGTLLLCFFGLSAVTFDFAKGLPMQNLIPSASARLLVTGLLFGGTGSLIAMSPIGKRSGAHLNPSVSLGFWARGKMHRKDVLFYVIAQLLGAWIGTEAVKQLWNGYARGVDYGMTLPGASFGIRWASIAEFMMTFGYVTIIFFFVSHPKLMRKTPLMNWIVIAILVWVEAPVSGTSLNAARSFGPAVISGDWQYQWIYFLAPASGALCAAFAYPFLRREKSRILTGKMFHEPTYPSLFKNVPNPDQVIPESFG